MSQLYICEMTHEGDRIARYAVHCEGILEAGKLFRRHAGLLNRKYIDHWEITEDLLEMQGTWREVHLIKVVEKPLGFQERREEAITALAQAMIDEVRTFSDLDENEDIAKLAMAAFDDIETTLSDKIHELTEGK